MASNPLEDSPERDRRIRERAYHLWEEDGRPHGREAEFWERAKELIGMEDNADAALLPNPMTEGPVPATEEPIEEAAIQENYGEFPGRLVDQGERLQTPKPRSRRRRS
ncbi:MAG: DUF2934 domain-containing protein [Acetobacteraceae bacterium]